MKIEFIKTHEDAVNPSYSNADSAGFSLVSLQDVTIHPNSTTAIRTGLAFDVPKGFELVVRPCDKFCRANDIRPASAPYSIDAGNKEELTILMDNIANRSYAARIVKKGDRIAVGVIQKVERAQLVLKEKKLEKVEKSEDTGSVGGKENKTNAKGLKRSIKAASEGKQASKAGKPTIVKTE